MSHKRYKDASGDRINKCLALRTRQATREHLEQSTAPLLAVNDLPPRRSVSRPRQHTATDLYTYSEDSHSDVDAEHDIQSDEAESTDDDDDADSGPVLDGELLQGENYLLKQELSALRDRLNYTKTELAFQQSRRPGDYDETYFKEQLHGLRKQIRDWCISYFENGRSYWTIPAERRFKHLCDEWAAFMADELRRPWLIQARIWYTLDQSLFNPASEKHSSWLLLAQKAGPSIDKMFAQAAEQSSPATKHAYREWRALTFNLLFPGKGQNIEPNAWLQAEFGTRARRLSKLLWSSLRHYMNRQIPDDHIAEAKEELHKITAAALYFHLDMMKYTVGLSFDSKDSSAGARSTGAQAEEVLGGSPDASVRLMISPPLYKDVSSDGTATIRQLLMCAQVVRSVLERQPRNPVEKNDCSRVHDQHKAH